MILSMDRSHAARLGAENLVRRCMRVGSDDIVLVLREPTDESCYSEDLIRLVLTVLRETGAKVRVMSIPAIPGPDDLPLYILNAIASSAHALFLARTGDQLRFSSMPGGRKTICYAKSLEFLGSDACVTDYAFTTQALARVQSVLNGASFWRVSCRSGTDIRGSIEKEAYGRAEAGAFSAQLFPAGVFRPVPCGNASGRIVTRWFPPVFTHRYEPFGMSTDEPVVLLVENGQIVEIEGPANSVAKIRDHYARIGGRYGDPRRVTSWHCGINAKVCAPCQASDDIAIWGGTMHLSPRWAHFHTCGGTPPGEINAVVVDPTFEVDGHAIWRSGVLQASPCGIPDEFFDGFSVSRTWFESFGALGIS